MQRHHHVDKPDYSAFLSLKVLAAALATLATHPLRVFLNQAAVNTNPMTTIEKGCKVMFNDAPLNIARGAAGTGMQSIVKHLAHLYFGHDYAGQFAGIGGATVSGTFNATFIETLFVRRNTMREMKLIGQYPLYRFNWPLAMLFGARETGFCINVFGTADAPWGIRLPVLLIGTYITAAPHKLAVIEATKDIRGISHLVPDWGIGYRAVFRNIAYGNYGHESLRPLIANPVTRWNLALNLMNATCGPNMYFYRLIFLLAFGEALKLANQKIPALVHQYGLFKPAHDSTPKEVAIAAKPKNNP